MTLDPFTIYLQALKAELARSNASEYIHDNLNLTDLFEFREYVNSEPLKGRFGDEQPEE
jgi:hypothetical protein